MEVCRVAERVKLVNLLLTRDCNLRCAYCYVRRDGHETMTLTAAQRAIEDAFARDAEAFDRLEFAFLGGEPFAAFPLLRQICEWMWSRQWPRPYCLSASTNGTLIRGECRRWLERNAHRIFLSLSCDGTADTQNRQRCGSAGSIDLDFFRRLWPQVPVKLTASEDCVASLAQDVISLKERGFLVNDTFADGTPPWSGEHLRMLDGQLAQLREYDLSHPQSPASRLLSIDLTPVLDGCPGDSFACGAGFSHVTYDWDGERYPCHLLSPLALSPEELADVRRDLANPLPCLAGCGSCDLDAVCPTCGGNAFRRHGSCWRREEKTCALFRHQVYHACVFQMKRLLRKAAPDEDDRRTCSAILRILRSPAMREVIAMNRSSSHSAGAAGPGA